MKENGEINRDKKKDKNKIEKQGPSKKNMRTLNRKITQFSSI